jgi:hypothetical protein
MANWLNAIADVLDQAKSPMQLFFRDDDAGWENNKLFSLLDRFAHAALPIDLAVIPESLDNVLASELLPRWRQNYRLLGLHQHGFSHTNHELNGRKCEFGGSRTKIQQKEDIAKGQTSLQAHFGVVLDPFFTPPWNRCTQATVDCLEELDFKVLSRDVSATKLESIILQDIPVHVDWSKILKQSDNPLKALGEAIAQCLLTNTVTGIMLHHADMDTEQLAPLTDMLTLLSSHHNVNGLLLRDILN